MANYVLSRIAFKIVEDNVSKVIPTLQYYPEGSPALVTEIALDQMSPEEFDTTLNYDALPAGATFI